MDIAGVGGIFCSEAAVEKEILFDRNTSSFNTRTHSFNQMNERHCLLYMISEYCRSLAFDLSIENLTSEIEIYIYSHS